LDFDISFLSPATSPNTFVSFFDYRPFSLCYQLHPFRSKKASQTILLIVVTLSRARSFIRNKATLEDLEEFKKLIEDREKVLKSSTPSE
jgi:hypothetical protein